MREIMTTGDKEKPKLFVLPTTFEGWVEKYLADLATEFTILSKKIIQWKEFLIEDKIFTNTTELEKAVKHLIRIGGTAPTYAQLVKTIKELKPRKSTTEIIPLHRLKDSELENWVKTNYPSKYEESKKNVTTSWMIRLLRMDLYEQKEKNQDETVRNFFAKFNPDFKAVYGIDMNKLAKNGFDCYIADRKKKYKIKYGLMLDIFNQRYSLLGYCLNIDLKRFYGKELRNEARN